MFDIKNSFKTNLDKNEYLHMELPWWKKPDGGTFCESCRSLTVTVLGKGGKVHIILNFQVCSFFGLGVIVF